MEKETFCAALLECPTIFVYLSHKTGAVLYFLALESQSELSLFEIAKCSLCDYSSMVLFSVPTKEGWNMLLITNNLFSSNQLVFEGISHVLYNNHILLLELLH